ncbi:hypothetical protein, partial [Streptomyces acidiscabies]|uniref:hypothetical protein n=1 Tax=Streptomyces acidiscabies TaxID=42234 RepID=UPI0021166390
MGVALGDDSGLGSGLGGELRCGEGEFEGRAEVVMEASCDCQAASAPCHPRQPSHPDAPPTPETPAP